MSGDTRGEGGSESTLRTEFTIAGPLPVPIDRENDDEPDERKPAQDLRADALADAEGLTGPAGLTEVTNLTGALGATNLTKRPAGGWDGVTPGGTIVIEDGVIPRRLRRPLDLARLALALAITAGSVALGWFATGTTSGLEQDLEGGAQLLPSAVVLVSPTIPCLAAI